MDILVASEATMSSNLPAVGNVTLFINTDKNNVLYYITSDGVIHKYSDGDVNLEECCSCEIAKKWNDAVTCALNSGLLTATQFGDLISQGLSVSTTESTDPNTGVRTCTVDIGPRNQAVLSLAIDQASQNLAALATLQLSTTILPATAPQGVIWISSDPTKATVSSTGLVTGIAAGPTTIYAYSMSNNAISDSIVITVTP